MILISDFNKVIDELRSLYSIVIDLHAYQTMRDAIVKGFDEEAYSSSDKGRTVSTFLMSTKWSYETSILIGLSTIYVKTGDAYTIEKLINIFKSLDKNQFSDEQIELYSSTQTELDSKYKSVQHGIQSIRNVRNKRLAHLDRKYLLTERDIYGENNIDDELISELIHQAHVLCNIVYSFLKPNHSLSPYRAGLREETEKVMRACFSI